MNLRSFILGLSASFGVAWLALIVVPYFHMNQLAPIPFEESTATKGVFYPKRTGRVTDGALVYAQNGCYNCHSQVVRPTYAGADMYRADWGGLKEDADRGDTRRETNAFDFTYENFAQIGVHRVGPDLSNLGRRVEALYAQEISPENWLYTHLYNPTAIAGRESSHCPPHPFLFTTREVKGAKSDRALPIDAGSDQELVPTPDARALVSYLLSLKKDHPVPPTLQFAPPEEEN